MLCPAIIVANVLFNLELKKSLFINNIMTYGNLIIEKSGMGRIKLQR
jgi:hypothetical protein